MQPSQCVVPTNNKITEVIENLYWAKMSDRKWKDKNPHFYINNDGKIVFS